jgi:hypothetical protein
MKRFLMKVAPVALYMLLATGPLFAQNDSIVVRDLQLKLKPPLRIGLTGGVSVPTGNFAKTDYTDLRSGFAGPCFNLGITGTYMITQHWGITGLVSYSRYDQSGLDNLAAGYVASFAVSDATIRVKDDTHTFSYLIGADYSLDFCHRIAIDLRAMTGLVHAQLAGYEVQLEDNVSSTFQQRSARANTIGYQIGVAARYNFNSRLGIALNFDYYYSDPDLSIENVNRANNAGRLLTRYNEPITGVNTDLSLVYTFQKNR